MASIFSDGNLNSFYNKTRDWMTGVSSSHSFRIIAHTEMRESGREMEHIHILLIADIFDKIRIAWLKRLKLQIFHGN